MAKLKDQLEKLISKYHLTVDKQSELEMLDNIDPGTPFLFNRSFFPAIGRMESFFSTREPALLLKASITNSCKNDCATIAFCRNPVSRGLINRPSAAFVIDDLTLLPFFFFFFRIQTHHCRYCSSYHMKTFDISFFLEHNSEPIESSIRLFTRKITKKKEPSSTLILIFKVDTHDSLNSRFKTLAAPSSIEECLLSKDELEDLDRAISQHTCFECDDYIDDISI